MYRIEEDEFEKLEEVKRNDGTPQLLLFIL